MAWPMSAAQTHSPAWPGRRLLDALDVTDLDTFDPRPGWQHRAHDDVLTIPVGAPVDAPDSVVSIELGDHANVALCGYKVHTLSASDCSAVVFPAMPTQSATLA